MYRLSMCTRNLSILITKSNVMRLINLPCNLLSGPADQTHNSIAFLTCFDCCKTSRGLGKLLEALVKMSFEQVMMLGRHSASEISSGKALARMQDPGLLQSSCTRVVPR